MAFRYSVSADRAAGSPQPGVRMLSLRIIVPPVGFAKLRNSNGPPGRMRIDPAPRVAEVVVRVLQEIVRIESCANGSRRGSRGPATH